jgi:hypothetical protein
MNLPRGHCGAFTHLARLTCIWAAAMLVGLSACDGLPPQAEQPTQPAQAAPKPKPVQQTKKTPKPEPTQDELFDYVRGKLLALTPSDGINDNLEVAFDPATSVLSITQPDGRCDIFLSNIDTNSPIWEVFDPSDSYHTREDVLRLTLTSLSGKKARTCYDKNNQVDTNLASNHARLLFSVPKANAIPGFSEKMGKAIKKLIVLAGGAPEKDIFKN